MAPTKLSPPTVMVAAAPSLRPLAGLRTRACEKGRGERDLRDVGMREGLERRWDSRGGKANHILKSGELKRQVEIYASSTRHFVESFPNLCASGLFDGHRVAPRAPTFLFARHFRNGTNGESVHEKTAQKGH